MEPTSPFDQAEGSLLQDHDNAILEEQPSPKSSSWWTPKSSPSATPKAPTPPCFAGKLTHNDNNDDYDSQVPALSPSTTEEGSSDNIGSHIQTPETPAPPAHDEETVAFFTPTSSVHKKTLDHHSNHHHDDEEQLLSPNSLRSSLTTAPPPAAAFGGMTPHVSWQLDHDDNDNVLPLEEPLLTVEYASSHGDMLGYVDDAVCWTSKKNIALSFLVGFLATLVIVVVMDAMEEDGNENHDDYDNDKGGWRSFLKNLFRHNDDDE